MAEVPNKPDPGDADLSNADPSNYSLADFFVCDSDDPTRPSADFLQWREQSRWATSIYEPSLLAGPVPRTRMVAGSKTHDVVNMSSYNYLGLATHPATIAAAKAALDRYGTGACGSPILSGMTDLHRELEGKLSAFLGREQTMLFNSGFAGALGTIAGLLRKGDVAIMDEKVHYSLLEGAKLAQARIELFAHNDTEQLTAALERTKGRRRLVVVEGLYSMDGDTADLPSLTAAAKAYDAPVLVDEAHSILTLGANGRGAVEAQGVEKDVTLAYGTFSKAFASAGGYVSGPTETLEYVRLYATPYGYSCALPPSVVAGVLAALDVATHDPSLRRTLADNAAYFRRELLAMGVDTGHSTTHVVPIIIGDDRRALYELAHQMLERGLFMAPVDYPSVRQDQVRYRASVTAGHTRADLDRALQIISDTIVRRVGRRV